MIERKDRRALGALLGLILLAGGCTNVVNGEIDGQKPGWMQSGFWIESPVGSGITVYLFSFPNACQKQIDFSEESFAVYEDFPSFELTEEELREVAERMDALQREYRPAEYWSVIFGIWEASADDISGESYEFAGTDAFLSVGHALDYADYEAMLIDGDLEAMNMDSYGASGGEAVLQSMSDGERLKGAVTAELQSSSFDDPEPVDAGEIDFDFSVKRCEGFEEYALL